MTDRQTTIDALTDRAEDLVLTAAGFTPGSAGFHDAVRRIVTDWQTTGGDVATGIATATLDGCTASVHADGSEVIEG